ncbi:DUF1840 family protein [Lacimicrobium alkaliphilum]|uniref:DUF1840 domain-containing protein n=1 Tax=Lacimicrobium alkaliphilum TaxID=1526571 RepID=A0ABQ1QZ89_9ALTE|nr:DUF1840 family protein [Lacimicrobium alkaliphilum]GGD52531.1 hypothetical protein GCM10011357_05480 [Lacimicrobium alkaliphilum]
MFGDVAVQLLKMMGQTGNVPGAIKGDDVEQACKHLERACKNLPGKDHTATSPPDNDQGYNDEDEKEEERNNPVSLEHRARPLLLLLSSAAKHKDYVSWEAEE